MVDETAMPGAKGLPGHELIDRDACMGSGNCLYWAPGVFELDDDGVAVVCGDLSAHEDQVRSAAQNCPTRAIRVDGFYGSP
jgi:ferredoxin